VKPVDVLGVRVEMPTNQPIVLLRERAASATCRSGSVRPRRPRSLTPSRASSRPRPLTHDLLKDVIETLGTRVTQVRIVELRDKVFYAILVIDGQREISARPSDADRPRAAHRDRDRRRRGGAGRGRGALTPEEDDEVEKFREFLDHVSPRTSRTPVDPQVDPGERGHQREP
jgi:hypothetical protein